MKDRSIAVGDVVVLEDERRGKVVLATRSGAHLLLRLNTSPSAGAEPAYLLCAAREVRRINSWWNRRCASRPESRRAA